MPRFRRARQRLESLIEDVLAEHETKAAMAERRDLIDDLIALHRSSLRVLLQTDMFIAAMGPFFVGLDTVAVATSFALYVLLKHPELFDRFRKEADELFVSGDPTPQGIHRMSTTQGVIMESLRMHTMVHARRAHGDKYIRVCRVPHPCWHTGTSCTERYPYTARILSQPGAVRY